MLSDVLPDFLSPDEIAATNLMRDQLGVDVTRTYQFWESAVARITTGTLTEHKCPWDIDLAAHGASIRIEVKFSQEFDCRFRNGTRPVFKFASPKGAGAEKTADVTVLVGIDAADAVHSWVVPSALVPHAASITLTSPRARQGGTSRSAIDVWRCPPLQILPEVLRAWRCHLAYDRDHHAETRAATREAARMAAGIEALFDRAALTASPVRP